MAVRLLQKLLGRLTRRSTTNHLEFACITNTGYNRMHNEDNFLFFGTVLPEEHQSLEEPLVATADVDELVTVAVFDGMGGELAGEAASCVAALCLDGLSSTLEPSEEGLQGAFRKMQDSVEAMRRNRRISTTGSTAVVLTCRDNAAAVGNLGDSKAFLLRGGKLSTLSVSHTDAEILAQLGLDQKPALTQFLGVDESDAPIEPHVSTLTLQTNDIVILASDGLTDMVDEATITREANATKDMSLLVSRLCQLALDNGGIDNVAIIACRAAADGKTPRMEANS